MAYFHVLLSLNDPQEKLRCVFSDLTEEKLFERFIKSYRQGRNFLSANEIIEISSIRKVQIIKTERKSEIELKEIQEKIIKNMKNSTAILHCFLLILVTMVTT